MQRNQYEFYTVFRQSFLSHTDLVSWHFNQPPVERWAGESLTLESKLEQRMHISSRSVGFFMMCYTFHLSFGNAEPDCQQSNKNEEIQ